MVSINDGLDNCEELSTGPHSILGCQEKFGGGAGLHVRAKKGGEYGKKVIIGSV